VTAQAYTALSRQPASRATWAAQNFGNESTGAPMSSNTSVGRGPAHGSNENHDGDPRNKTLGEKVSQDEPPMGNNIVDGAGPDVPAGLPGAKPKPGIENGPGAYPDGPNVEASPWELEAARGKLPPK
jgi:hypothetical protein